MGRRPRLEPIGRRRRGWRRRPPAPPRRHDALPRPVLAGRAVRRGRPPLPERGCRRRRCRRSHRRACSAVRRSRAGPPAPRCSDCRPAPSSGDRRRPRHGEDDHRHADPRSPRQAGRGRRRSAAARRPRRADRKGSGAAGGIRPRRSVCARAERAGAGAATRDEGVDPAPAARPQRRQRQSFPAPSPQSACRTTSSSSTRPRWSRSRSWRACSRRSAATPG